MSVRNLNSLNSHELQRAVRRHSAGWLAVFALVVSASAACGQESAPGVRRAAPGQSVTDRRQPVGELSYFGILGAVQRPNVYSSQEAGVALTGLVESAGGLREGASRMAHIIRDGRAGLWVSWTADSPESLLPGDVVVFSSQQQPQTDVVDRSAPVPGTTRPDDKPAIVSVAFVGLIDRRPVIVPLDRRFATVGHVLSALQQPAEVAQSVRVIAGRPHGGVSREGSVRESLADGDVLVFDRRALDMMALARTQSDVRTAFPAAVPLQRQTASPDVDPAGSPAFLDVTPTLSAAAVPTPPQEPTASSETGTPAGLMAAHTGFDGDPRTSDVQSGIDRHIVDREVEPVATGSRGGERPSAPVMTSSSRPSSSEPLPTLSLDESAPRVVSVIDPADLVFDDPLSGTVLSDYASLPALPPSTAARSFEPEPLEPTPVPAASAARSGLNPWVIAVGVLGLAVMCFGVSVLWSRIDRAAQSLQQPIPSVQAAADTVSRRRILNRLISNNLPIIEEYAQLPERMDYHGEELGRRRMMLDQPHDLAGPHFAVAARAGAADTDRASSVSSVLAESSVDVPVADERTSPDSPPEEAGVAPLFRRVDTREEGTAGVPESPAADHQRAPSRLLERVLIAMERERRR